MIPTQGRSVTVIGVPSNGISEQAAVITRVWSTGRDTRLGAVAVNLTVFPDCSMPQLHSSVLLYETRDEAMASGDRVAAFWPQREPQEPEAAASIAPAQLAA